MLARLGPEIIDVEPADDDLSGAKANPRRVQSSSPGAYQLKGGVPATGDPGTNHRLLNLKRWRTSQPVIVDTYPADLDLAEVRVVSGFRGLNVIGTSPPSQITSSIFTVEPSGRPL